MAITNLSRLTVSRRQLCLIEDRTFESVGFAREAQRHAGDVLFHTEADNRFWTRQEQTLLTLLAIARARGDRLEIDLLEQAIDDGRRAEEKRKGGLRKAADALIAALGKVVDQVRRVNGYVEQIRALNRPARAKTVEIPCLIHEAVDCECFGGPGEAA